jgi:hypothetical protein
MTPLVKPMPMQVWRNPLLADVVGQPLDPPFFKGEKLELVTTDEGLPG